MTPARTSSLMQLFLKKSEPPLSLCSQCTLKMILSVLQICMVATQILSMHTTQTSYQVTEELLKFWLLYSPVCVFT